jgi:Lipase 3 N-terminal region
MPPIWAAILCLVGAAWAAPIALEQRGEVAIVKPRAEYSLTNGLDVSAGVLNQLNLWEQYAAAAYCPANNDSPGDELSCEAGNCPLVQTASTTTSIEFQKCVPQPNLLECRLLMAHLARSSQT